MTIVKILSDRLSNISRNHDLKSLQKSYLKLSEEYRKSSTSLIRSTEEALAYAMARMPATASVVEDVLSQIDQPPQRLLDLGAGTGAACFVAKQLWPNVDTHAVEQNPYMLDVCTQLSAPDSSTLQSIENFTPKENYDCVILSYVLGEVTHPREIFKQALSYTRDLAIIILPGTPRDFAKLKDIRDLCITEKLASILAPCTHQSTCQSDWCHFYAKVMRTREHKFIKNSILGYEEEPYAYLVVSKQNNPESNPVLSRIISKPFVNKFSANFQVCHHTGISQMMVTRRDKNNFKAAKKSHLGDLWPPVETTRNS